MFRRSRAKRTPGQALVEFALAATLIFVLLSAAIDLGLIFFTLQGLRTAAQEGANFGSHPVMVMNGSTLAAVDLPYNEVVQRVRLSGGPQARGFVNLLDLNNDGVNDLNNSGQPTNAAQSSIVNRNDWDDPNAYIRIENLKYPGDNVNVASSGPCETTVARQDMRNAGRFCYVRVTVSYNYRFIFPLAPVFADTFRLRASYMIRVRTSFIG
jgi:hypothetical protein